MPSPNVPEITVQELKSRLDRGETPHVLDVRQPNEYEIVNLDGQLIPLGELPERLGEIEAGKGDEIVVHCRSGGRSAKAVEYLQSQGYTGAKNLKGGVLAWSAEVDPSMPTY